MRNVGVGRDFRRGSGHLGRFSNGKLKPLLEKPQTRLSGRVADLPEVGAVRSLLIPSSAAWRLPDLNGRKILGKFRVMRPSNGSRSIGCGQRVL